MFKQELLYRNPEGREVSIVGIDGDKVYLKTRFHDLDEWDLRKMHIEYFELNLSKHGMELVDE